jgi:hypothetical protein
MTLPFPIQFASNGPQWAQGFDAWYDYTKPQGSQLLAFPPATDTHSATVYAQSSSGVWQAIPANVPSRTDLGLQTVPTRANLVANTDLSNAYWTLGANLARGASSTVGGLPMWTFTSSAASLSFNRRNIAVSSSTQYTYAYWSAAQITTGSNVVVAQPSNTNYTLTGIQIGSLWYYSVTFTVGASDTSLNVFTGPVDAPAAATFTVGAPILVQAAFAGPPIPTTGSPATVNGNQQVINIGANAANGFGLIMQFNALDAAAQFKRIVGISDGTGNNAAVLYWDTGSGAPLQQVVTGAINQGNVLFPGTNSTGLQTIVMVAGPNYSRGQKIGFAAATTDTTVTWPAGLTQLAIAGQGFATTDNMYMQTRRLAIRFGAANDAMFNDLVAKATILNAVS